MTHHSTLQELDCLHQERLTASASASLKRCHLTWILPNKGADFVFVFRSVSVVNLLQPFLKTKSAGNYRVAAKPDTAHESLPCGGGLAEVLKCPIHDKYCSADTARWTTWCCFPCVRIITQLGLPGCLWCYQSGPRAADKRRQSREMRNGSPVERKQTVCLGDAERTVHAALPSLLRVADPSANALGKQVRSVSCTLEAAGAYALTDLKENINAVSVFLSEVLVGDLRLSQRLLCKLLKIATDLSCKHCLGHSALRVA